MKDWILEAAKSHIYNYAQLYSIPEINKYCVVNEKALLPITKKLIKNNGICPCCHEEWDDNTPIEDKQCPCKTFRDTGDCHCNLYKIEEN